MSNLLKFLTGKGTSTPLEKNAVNYGGWLAGPQALYSNQAGTLDRMVDGVRYIISDVQPNTWFSPSQPLAPYAQEERGRRYDYMTGYNLNITPRANAGVSFAQLRALADSYDILRLLIENRKDQISQLEWQVVPVDWNGDKRSLDDPRIKRITEFLKFPDRVTPWRSWVRALAEDMLVLDALTIYPRYTRGGELYSLELIDGATITPKLNHEGRRPLPPDVAYQQIIKGVPMADFNAEQLVYFPRNIRTDRVYGFSPVEQIIITVNIAMRRQAFQLAYYTDGSMPDALIQVPDTWQPDQIAEFQAWWDSILQGNLQGRRMARFVPAGTKIEDTRKEQLSDQYDEWLARVCCFAFGTSPQPFIKMMNRATAETLKVTAEEEGVRPWALTLLDVMNYIVQFHFNEPDLKFMWTPGTELDPLKRAQAEDIEIKNGVRSVDEVRISHGLAPVGMGNAVYTPQGPVLLSTVIDGSYVPGGPQGTEDTESADQTAAGKPEDEPAKGSKDPKKVADKIIKQIKTAADRLT
jgi:hypothetical protein